MVERNVGQMCLADGLVQTRRSSILDEVEAVVDWAPLRSLLGKRGGDGAGNSSYPAEYCFAACLPGYGTICLIPLWKPPLQIGCRSVALLVEFARSNPGPQYVVAVSAGTRQGRADREDFR